MRDVVGTPIRAGDLPIGDLVNAVPDGIFDLEGVELQVAKSKSAVIMVKMEPEEIIPGAGRENWSVQGIICYSKICSHVGLPDLALRAHHAPRAVPLSPIYFRSRRLG